VTQKSDETGVSPETLAADQEFRDQLVKLIPALRSFARGLCGWRDMADDMAQEAMVRGWAARASYTPGTNFRAWMFMILRNQFYSTLRKDKRMTSWDPEVAERLLVEGPAQQHAIHAADVAKALQQLPAEQREVLLLVGANGLSYEEAAEISGCAIGTIKSRLARGRRALALLIDGPEGDALFTAYKPESGQTTAELQ
jgi:RNA polymerase sigma-70 factor (ECF subfamily)